MTRAGLSRAFRTSVGRRGPRRRGAVMERFIQSIGQAFKGDPSIKLTDKITHIAERFSISRDYVRLLLPRAGCEINRPLGAGNRTGVSEDQILQAVKEDEAENGKRGSSQRVAERFGLSPTYVNQIRRRAGFPAGRQMREYDKEEAKRRYQSKDSTREIARDSKIGELRLKKDLLGMGEVIRHKAWRIRTWHSDRQQLVDQGKILAAIRKLPESNARVVLYLIQHPDGKEDNATVRAATRTNLSTDRMRILRGIARVPGPKGRPRKEGIDAASS